MATRRIVQRPRKPAEEAKMIASLVSGLNLEQTRLLLKDAGFGDHELPKRSWTLLTEAYSPRFLNNPRLMGESICAPKPMGGLPEVL